MSYPNQIFTSGAQLGPLLDEIIDVIVTNSGYMDTDAEIIALREIATEIIAATDAFIDLDSYPAGEPNTKALRERLMLALSGINITNGSETTLP